MNSKKDYYELLGVSKTATDEEIKRAFRKLAKMYHPDNKETGDEAKFKEIGEAYAILSDPQKEKHMISMVQLPLMEQVILVVKADLILMQVISI